MMHAIETLVTVFETLLYSAARRPGASRIHSANDNHEMNEDERRWIVYR